MTPEDLNSLPNLHPAAARRRVKSTKSTRHHRHTSSIKARKELERLRSRKKYQHTLTIDCIGKLNIHHSNVKKKRTFRKSGDSYYVILCRLPETTNLNKNEPSYAKKKRADSLEPALLIFPNEKKGKKFIEETKKDSVFSERFQTRLCDFAVGLIILTDECVVARSVDIGIALLKKREQDQRMLPVEKLRDLLFCDDECQFQVMFKKNAHVFVAKDELVCNKWFKSVKESLMIRREENSAADKKENSDSDVNSTGDVEEVKSRKDWLKQAQLDKKARKKRSQPVLKTSKSQIIKKTKYPKPKSPLKKYRTTTKLKSGKPAAPASALSLPMKDRKEEEKISDTSDSICWERSFSTRVIEALTHMLAISSKKRNVKHQHTLTLQQLKKMIETRKQQAEEFLDRGGKESKLEYVSAGSLNVLPLVHNLEPELSELSQNNNEMIQRPSLEVLNVANGIKSPPCSGLPKSITYPGLDDQIEYPEMKFEDEIILDLSSCNTTPRVNNNSEVLLKLPNCISPSLAPVQTSEARHKNRLRSNTWAKSYSIPARSRQENECQMVQLKIYPVPIEYQGNFFEKFTEMLFRHNLIGGSTRIVVSKNGNCRFYVRREAVEDGTILLFQDQLHDQWKNLHCIVDRSKTKVRKLTDFIDSLSQKELEINGEDSKRSVKANCDEIITPRAHCSDDEIDPCDMGRVLPRRYSLRAAVCESTTIQVIGNSYNTLTLEHTAKLGDLTRRLDSLVRDWELRDWEERHHFCFVTDTDGPIYLNDLNDQILATVVALDSQRNRISVLTLPRYRPRIASTIFQFENDYSNWEDQTLKGIFFDEWRTEDEVRKRFCESYLINFFRLFILNTPYELRIFASFYLTLHPILLEALTPALSRLLEETLKSRSIPDDIKERLQTYQKHLVGATTIS